MMDTSEARHLEVSKSQAMRLFDVFVLGPFMISYASKKRQPPFMRLLLGVFGVTTILYNARNYQMTRDLEEGSISDGHR